MGLKQTIKKFLGFSKPAYFIHKTAIIDPGVDLVMGNGSEIWEHAIIRRGAYVRVGDHSQIGPFTVLFSGSGISIGNNVMIAPHCVIAAGNHDYKQTAKPMRFAEGISKGPIVIEDNVWIGANCTLTDGVTIKKEAVIAANTVVTKDINEYEIVAGTPGVVIGHRKPNTKTT